MQVNKIWKSLLVLLITVLIGLSVWACILAQQTAERTGGEIRYDYAFEMVFTGAGMLSFIVFVYSLPILLMIATIYRLFKGFN
jgi:hypothetical protein